MSGDFNNNELRKFDGALLLVFRELLARRRASEAALRLGLSPSAVSHALARLRDLFGDPLFIRRSHGLEPTERALELGPRVEALLELANATLSPRGAFDPARSRRRFNIGTPGEIMSLLGPTLLLAFEREAPGSSFLSRPLLLDRAVDALRRGEIDLALGPFGRLPPDLQSETLYEDRYCVVAREGHPAIDGSIDLATYARTGHVFVGHPTPGVLDGFAFDPDLAAETYGTIPSPDVVRTSAYVSQLETAMLMTASSDVIADCPRSLAHGYAARLGLQVLDPPYEAAPSFVRAVWRSGRADGGVDWLLAKVRAAVTPVP